MIVTIIRHVCKRKETCLLLGFFLTFYQNSLGREISRLDSLVSIYESARYSKHDELFLLKEIGDLYNNPDKILWYSDILIQKAKKADSIGYEYVGYTQRGAAYQLKSDYSKALESYFEAAKFAHKDYQKGTLYFTIADVYSLLKNHLNAVKYYKLSIGILKNVRDSISLATALYNLGDEYLKAEMPDSALQYTGESQKIANKMNYQIGQAYCLGNLGVIYLKKDNQLLAENYLNQSIALLEEMNEYAAICEFLRSMSEIHHKKNNLPVAIQYADRSLALATQHGLKSEISQANLKLSELYEASGNLFKSLQYYKAHIAYRDSVSNLESVEKIAELRTNYEVSQKQKEVDLLYTRNKLRVAEQNGFVFASLLLASILLLSIYFYKQRAKRNKLLAAQEMQEVEILHQKNLMQSVITSQEVERKRIGMDLHDEVGAALSTLRIKIDQGSENRAEWPQLTSTYKGDIDKIISNMRNISHALSPRISGRFGFYDALHELADSVNESGKISMVITFDEEKLPHFANEQAPMAIYRVIAELINNTLKHAHATTIHLEVAEKENVFDIRYSDDGIGIKPSIAKTTNGIGMKNIESRLLVIGAHWEVGAPVTGGYQMEITVPLN